MIHRKLPEGDCGYCGSGIFTSPLRSYNPFHKYCIDHDLGYYVSQQVWAKGVVENDNGMQLRGLEIRIMADKDFYEGCMKRAEESWLITHIPMRVWAKSYIKAVKMVGEKVWWKSSRRQVQRFRKMADRGVELQIKKATNYLANERLKYKIAKENYT